MRRATSILCGALSALLLTALVPAPLGYGEAVAGSEPARDPRPAMGVPDLRAARSSRPGWKRRIDRIAEGKDIGIAVRLDDRFAYRWGAKARRIPASNEKLLLSMALFDRLPPGTTFVTKVSAGSIKGARVIGDLWLSGTGDPAVTAGGGYAKGLGFSPTRINGIAAQIKNAGIVRITGGVKGATNYFSRDWWANGWRSYFPGTYISLPTALTLDGNRADGSSITDPERRAAAALTKRLRKLGVKVRKKPGAGVPPAGTSTIVKVSSAPIEELARFMNKYSSNFFAEVLGKRLGAERWGRPGTIAKGASAIARYAEKRGVTIRSYDSSGLSYSNRVSPNGLVKLLDDAEDASWWDELRSTLPKGGQGTLKDRLRGVTVRAKTGTLTGYSALSGWVWVERAGAWAAFSILSRDMPKSKASDVEDRIVRILEERAR